MKHVILEGKNKFSFQDKPLKYHHEIMKTLESFPVKFVGICHSDITIANNPDNLPIVLGHEVVCYKIINNVTQYYVLCNEIYCGKCQYCDEGNFSHCNNLIELGVNEHGGYAEFIRARRSDLIPIYFKNPKIGIFVEPFSCVLHAAQRIIVLLESNQNKMIKILIVGSGVIGKMFAHLLCHSHLSCKIYVYDIKKSATISLMGSEKIIPVNQLKNEKVDMIIESSGSTCALKTFINSVKKSGTLFLFGLYSPKVNLPLSALELVKKEVTISSSFAGSNNRIGRYSMMKASINYIAENQPFFESLLGDSTTLDKLPEIILKKEPRAGTRTFIEIT